MSKLQDKLAQQVPALRETVKKLMKESGAVKISEVTVEQAYGGMRGVKSLVCDTSGCRPTRGSSSAASPWPSSPSSCRRRCSGCC